MERDAANDAELVADTLAGDREAFGRLYDRYARLVRAVVLGVSGDWSAVDDMVQESFLRAYGQLAKLRIADRFGPWIVGIARHVARERKRSLRRDRHEFRDLPDVESESLAGGDTIVEEREQLEWVLCQVAQLPERERLAVHAFFLERQNAEQAAALVGLSRSGFYALVQRAVARLAAQLKSHSIPEWARR